MHKVYNMLELFWVVKWLTLILFGINSFPLTSAEDILYFPRWPLSAFHTPFEDPNSDISKTYAYNSYYSNSRSKKLGKVPYSLIFPSQSHPRNVVPELINREGYLQNIELSQHPSFILPSSRALCPEHFAYSIAHKRCFKIGSKGPCKDNMRFYLEGKESYGIGSCDCDTNVGFNCGRPLIYWKDDEWCYPVNSQGPCATHQWIVLNANGQAKCEPNPCLFYQKLDSAKDSDCIHWIFSKGECHETLTQAYCKNYQVLTWNIYDPEAIGPTCSSLFSPQSVPLKIDITQISNRLFPCLPGQKQNMLGKC